MVSVIETLCIHMLLYMLFVSDMPVCLYVNKELEFSWNDIFMVLIYHQTSNISLTLVGNISVDHSNYIFILDLPPGFNGLGKYSCKTG